MTFVKGKSGNPAGRVKDKTPATQFRKTIVQHMPEIITMLVEQAKAGDVAAAKVLLERVCPTLKPMATPVNIPIAGSLAQQGDEIIRATMTGSIPPDIGAQLITALANQSKVIEIEELTARLERIERQVEGRQ
ncbi:MAG: hypothetical protein K9L60_02330 [Methylovulum sp.]|nr:hypothetical protein [Methylovulum sp.]MCF7997960.1 hypothetical protein [Methylovulum sp.]